MTDPAMLAIATAAATAMAGKTAESLSEAAKRAMGTLIVKIRERLRARPDDERVLDAIETDPDSETSHQALATALSRISEEDPTFRDEILDLSHEAGIHIPVQADSANIVNAGHIGKMISAGRDINISGDLSL
jgi:hypothetical protein